MSLDECFPDHLQETNLMRRLLGALFIMTCVAASPLLAAQGKSGAHRPAKTTTQSAGPKAKSTGPKTTTGHGKPATAGAPKNHTKPTTPSANPHIPGTISVLPKNQQLVTRLQGLLPPGTDMVNASTGWKNQGQFVAAVHVSNNLGIPFADLKTRMVMQGQSLGEAIHQLRPGVDSEVEARRASEQARIDLEAPRHSSKRR
jgi:hypothetical protein